MKTRWIVVLVLVAAAHFAATAGTHLFTSGSCEEAPGLVCRVVAGTASILALPLLPVALGVSPGMGWRRAFVVFSANSVLVSALLTGIWALARASRASRAA